MDVLIARSYEIIAWSVNVNDALEKKCILLPTEILIGEIVEELIY